MVYISVPESPGLKAQGRKSSSNKMVAGLNQVVARQSKMGIKNHNTEHRVKTHTYIAILCQLRSPRINNIKH